MAILLDVTQSLHQEVSFINTRTCLPISLETNRFKYLLIALEMSSKSDQIFDKSWYLLENETQVIDIVSGP